MAETSYSMDGTTFEEAIARWTAGIPDDLRPPADGTPRARILAAATQRFATQGFSGSTTRAIADAANVNQAMIHYYFRTKTHLYERVLSGMVIDLLSSLAGSLRAPAATPIDTLVEFPERIIGVFASDPMRVAILRREIGDGAPHLRAVVNQLGESGPRGFSVIMMKFIESARGKGALAPDPAPAILEFLLVHAYGALLIEPMLQHVFASSDERESLEKIVISQRDLVRRALRPPKEEEAP